MLPLYPEREMWFAASLTTGTTGVAVDMTKFVANVGSAVIFVPPTLAAARTITFETAPPSAADPCLPDDLLWAEMSMAGICDSPTPLAVVVDPTDADFSATLGKACRIPLQCRNRFVRAKLSVATVGLTVAIVGRAARLDSV